jgi:hypothetical protein
VTNDASGEIHLTVFHSTDLDIALADVDPLPALWTSIE